MKKFWLSSLILAASMTLASQSHARGGGSGMLFDINLYYVSQKIESKNAGGSASVDSDGTTAIYDIKLGSLQGSGMYFGGMYTSRSNSALNQSGTGGSALGASIGYFAASGGFVMAHYLINASLGVLSEGTGIQGDVGYKIDVGSNWMLGGELSYRSITYKKSSNNASLESYKVDDIIPMLSLGFIF